MPSSSRSSQLRDQTQVSCIAGRFLTREALSRSSLLFYFKHWVSLVAQRVKNPPMQESVQSLSRVRLFVTSCTSARQASLSITNSWNPLKLMSIASVMPSEHLILCRPFILPPSILPSIRVFSKESALHIRWSKYWSCSFSTSPSNEYSGLISFRIDRLNLLVVQETLKSLLKHHSSKASILRCSAFFIVPISHIYT